MELRGSEGKVTIHLFSLFLACIDEREILIGELNAFLKPLSVTYIACEEDAGRIIFVPVKTTCVPLRFVLSWTKVPFGYKPLYREIFVIFCVVSHEFPCMVNPLYCTHHCGGVKRSKRNASILFAHNGIVISHRKLIFVFD